MDIIGLSGDQGGGMARLAILGSILLGLFLFLFGIAFQQVSMFFIGLIIVIVTLIAALRPGGILRREQVWDDWGVLVEDGQGQAERVFQETKSFIEKSQAPSLRIEMKKMAPSEFRLGERREFLEITDFDNPRLKPYQIFVNARDYGKNLDISWYLTFRPTLWQALLSMLLFKTKPGPTAELDLFDLQDLRAYVTNCHHCLLKAVEKLMLELDQDPSKINRKSRGFLGVS
jgi:hypothetical protein